MSFCRIFFFLSAFSEVKPIASPLIELSRRIFSFFSLRE